MSTSRSGPPPVGTVTFLLTDIEGSTRIWEADPEAMRAALEWHDARLKGAPGGWHYHGAHDTYFHVLAGTLRFEFGPGGRLHLEVGPGDFAFVPRETIHREATISSDPGELVLVRVGSGVTLVNVEGPGPA